MNLVKNKGTQLFLTVPTSLALLGLMVNVERVSAILSLRALIQNQRPLSIAD